MTATTAGIEAFCHSLEAVSGLRYDASKAYLFESRLRGVFPEGVPSYAALAMLVRAGGEPARRIVEALVTHETYFFRDEGTFAALPALAAGAQRDMDAPLVLWSVGASTGQELWSALWALDEAAPGSARQVRAYGLDISTAALARAQAGTYSALEVGRGLSDARRARYLEPVPGGWQVKAAWRALPQWVQANVTEALPPLPRPHVVLCRNLLIYFSEATRTVVLQRLADRLAEGGSLVLGSSETILSSDVVVREAPPHHFAYRRASGVGLGRG